MYELGPYIIGIVSAVTAISDTSWISPPLIIFLIFFLYPANIYIYGINDIYDYETDLLNPKKVSYESLVLPSERKFLFTHIALVSIPFFIYAFYIGIPLYILITFLSFFFFAGFYSAPPIRAKGRAFFDSIFSAGHYVATGLFSYLLTLYLTGNSVSWVPTIVCVTAALFWAISMHAYSAVPDIQADRDAKLSTIAISLGKNKTIILCAILYALSGILSFAYLGFTSLILSLVYVVFMIASLKTDDRQLFKIYTYFPIINTLSGMIIFFTIFFTK